LPVEGGEEESTHKEWEGKRKRDGVPRYYKGGMVPAPGLKATVWMSKGGEKTFADRTER